MILHVGDRYNRIVDVMNTCFGWNYKSCMKGFYALNKDKRTYAWFPKIADLSGGTLIPGDKWYGWCNTFSEDGNYIYMNNYENPELLVNEETEEISPYVTFVKYPKDKQYTYAGVYACIRTDTKLGWVFKKIAEDIDTAQYL